MLRYTFLISALLLCFTARAQFPGYPDIVQRSASAEGFIPAGWKTLSRCEGDMNRDGYPDVAIVLESPDSVPGRVSLKNAYCPALLLILFYDPAQGEYYLAEKSETFVTLPNAVFNYDTFERVSSLSNGDIRFEFDYLYSGGTYNRCTALYTFRYRKGRFVLIREQNTIRDTFLHNGTVYQQIDYRKRLARRWIVDSESGKPGPQQITRFRLKKLLTFDDTEQIRTASRRIRYSPDIF